MNRVPAIAALVLAALAGCEDLPGSAVPEPHGGVQLVYRTPHSLSISNTRIVSDGARLFLGGAEAGIVAFDRATGAQLWWVRHLGQPSTDGARVYAGSGDSARAYDPATGQVLWTTAVAGGAAEHRGDVREGVYYIGTDSLVYALDANSGTVRWVSSVAEGWEFTGRVRALTAADDGIYVCVLRPLNWNGAIRHGHVLRLNKATGAVEWRYVMAFETEYNFCIGEPVVLDTQVILSDVGGNATVAVERSSGRFLWRRQGEFGWLGPWNSISVRGDTLFGASYQGTVFAINRRSGALIWEHQPAAAGRDAQPCGRVLLFNNFDLLVLDRATGRQLGERFEFPPHPADEFLTTAFYVSGRDAWVAGSTHVYQFRCPT